MDASQYASILPLFLGQCKLDADRRTSLIAPVGTADGRADFCLVKKCFSVTENVSIAFVIFDIQRVLSLTVRVSRPIMTSSYLTENPISLSIDVVDDFLMLGPTDNFAKNRGCR